MSKNTRAQQGNDPVGSQKPAPETSNPAEPKPEDLGQPELRERGAEDSPKPGDDAKEGPNAAKEPSPLTVDQYLWRAGQEKSISDLIRSLYRTKTMSLADWESETGALLKKKTW